MEQYKVMRYEVLTAVKMSILVFRVVTMCGKHFWRNILHPGLLMEAVCSSEMYIPTSPHSIITQKTNTDKTQ
jgi:hypothetical protein